MDRLCQKPLTTASSGFYIPEPLHESLGLLVFGGIMLSISDLKFKKKITESLGVVEEKLKDEVREELK